MTLLRRAEYVALRRLALTGKIIDLGGVSDASYHALFRGEFSVNVANNEKKPDQTFCVILKGRCLSRPNLMMEHCS